MVKIHKRAFTLIELLVVIAIISLLLAIIMPAFSKVKKIARKVVCAAHHHGLGLAFQTYVEDNDQRSHWGPNGGLWYETDSSEMIDPDNKLAYWGVAYFPYASNPAVFHCPSFGKYYEVQKWDTSETYADETMYENSHFGLNAWISCRVISKIKSPYSMIVMQDHAEPKLENNGDTFSIRQGNSYNESYNLTQWRDKEYGVASCFRHQRSHYERSEEAPYSPKGTGYSNTLWLDGHVSSIEQTTGEDVDYRWYTGGEGDSDEERYLGRTVSTAYEHMF